MLIDEASTTENNQYICFKYTKHHVQERYFYRPQLSCGKVMFSQASAILFTEGISEHALGQTLPQAEPHPRTDTPLGIHPPRQTSTPQWPLQRTVRILLECILVYVVSKTSIELRFFKGDHHIHCIICQNGIQLEPG